MNNPLEELNLINIETATRPILPGLRVGMTPSLWRAVAGNDPLEPDDERLRELCFYVLFAVAGMIERTDKDREDLLVPVAFDTGTFRMRIVARRDAFGANSLTLSLADENTLSSAL